MRSWDRRSGRIVVRDVCTGEEQRGLGGTRALSQTLAPVLSSSWGALPLQFREQEEKVGTGTGQQQCQR